MCIRDSFRRSQSMQCRNAQGHPRNKPTILIYHSEEPLNRQAGVRCREMKQVLHSWRKRFDALKSDQVSQVPYFGHTKRAFLPVDADAVGREKSKQLAKMMPMGRRIWTSHKLVGWLVVYFQSHNSYGYIITDYYTHIIARSRSVEPITGRYATRPGY